jgi:phospholipid/cholesterol/gamma-HCH transport system ATP-binding protein
MRSSTSSPDLPGDVVLAVNDLTGPEKEPFLHGVSLCVRAGETVVVLGPIHSGKSLLLRHIVGLERAEGGSISVAGETFDASRSSASELRRRRARIGVLFEGSALLRHVTVVENVELPLLEHGDVGSDEARRIAFALLDEVGVHADWDAVPADLNRAAQRQVALARAVAIAPVALLLDEPAAGLDANAANDVDRTVTQLQRKHNLGVVIFSHDVRYIYGPVAEIDVLVNGRIIARGDRDTLLASDDPVVHRLLQRRMGSDAR